MMDVSYSMPTVDRSAAEECKCGSRLNQVGNVHRHLLNLSVVESLDIFQCATVVDSHEVDRDAFATESTASTNSEKDT